FLLCLCPLGHRERDRESTRERGDWEGGGPQSPLPLFLAWPAGACKGDSDCGWRSRRRLRLPLRRRRAEQQQVEAPAAGEEGHDGGPGRRQTGQQRPEQAAAVAWPFSSSTSGSGQRRPQRSFLIMVCPKGDEKILSFGDVVLRRSDLDILRGPHYINDRIIEFFLCDLSTSTSLDDILHVPPSISFWIANCPDDDSLRDAVQPLKLQEKSTVLLTVNDNDDVTVAEGGHHWSLLAYDRRKNVFVHHDSLRGMNSSHAEKLYKRLKRFLGDLGSSAGYVEGFTPRQENGYDCGLFVMAIAKLIVEWHVQRRELDEQWIPLVVDEVNASTVGQMREQILSRIEHLMEQQKGGGH
ncbi:hypothetical protein Taro_018348, partial [Colocasia esculenta]|nr:hypothetical protein [Colocasia esculenta]